MSDADELHGGEIVGGGAPLTGASRSLAKLVAENSGGIPAVVLAGSGVSQQKQEAAMRFDAGKPQFELIPADALLEVAKVYEMGARKYAADNWAKGMSWRRIAGSMFRHLFAWLSGEDTDKESGLHHGAHVAWGALTMIAYAKRKVGTDDREKGGVYA